MLCDDFVLAPLQGMIQFSHDADLMRDEVGRSQGLLGRRRKMHQHQLDAEVVRRPLDLDETIRRGGIDAGDQLEVEHQVAAFRMLRQQHLDMLVKPVGRAEEQIALQVQALDLAAMRRKHRLIVARAIERTAIFRAIETVFDGVDARRAKGKGRAADHDADQDARNETHCTMMTMIASSDRYSEIESRRRDCTVHRWSWSAPR